MRKFLVVLAGAVVFAAFCTAASADQPTRSEITGTFDGVLPAGQGCLFDIQVHAQMNARLTVFVDKSGGTRKEQYHIAEQDTFSANGKTLVGVPFTFNVTWLYDAAGNIVHVYADGVMEKVPLPDGGLFISAGRVDFAAHGLPAFILTPDHGGTSNLDGFCSALAP